MISMYNWSIREQVSVSVQPIIFAIYRNVYRNTTQAIDSSFYFVQAVVDNEDVRFLIHAIGPG